MGFNNPGALAFARVLQACRDNALWPRHPVGINLGKSKITPLDQAPGDYAATFKLVRPLADFFVVNVSSPNTPNLRRLQDKTALAEIFEALRELNTAGPPEMPSKPILVKIAPDLSFEALDEILELVASAKIAGIVATNTTLSRPASTHPQCLRTYAESGGLSGKPLRNRSTEIIRHLHTQSRGRLPIIGVGGIFNAEDAWEKILAGASLVQVYTGLVYEGPGLPQSIVRGLRRKLDLHSFKQLSDAVGAGNTSGNRSSRGS
jgi:dihydroorotate dehydrogenase